MKNISVMIKPASGLCNMRCRYCFYRDVAQSREEESFGLMSEETLEHIVRRVCGEAQESCAFVFQGGEPTLAGLDFFRTLVRLEKQYGRPGLTIRNAIQTNGYCMDEEWARFLGEEHFLVGLSVDGTQSLHDEIRPDAAGNGTFSRVTQAAELLTAAKAEFNILTVVTRQIAQNAKPVYEAFRERGWRYLQFIPCLDPYHEARGGYPWSLTAEDYGKFLCDLFDCWYRDLRRGRYVSIRYFDDLLEMSAGYPPVSCGLLGNCPAQTVIEADGSVYPCDFYVTDEWRCGNIRDTSLQKLLASPAALRFRTPRKPDTQCLNCRWAALCRGGCRRDCDTAGTLGHNYFCPAYQAFFSYAAPRLQEAVRLLYSDPAR